MEILNTSGFTENVNENIEKIKNANGEHFEVSYTPRGKTSVKIPITIKKLKHELLNREFYVMYYDMELDNNKNKLRPFDVWFVNYNTFAVDNSAYIANIHKLSNLSGSDVVYFVLEILKELKVKKVSLHDGAEVQCEKNHHDYRLSILKLLEKKETYYMRFGFKPDVEQQSVYIDSKYSNNKSVIDRISDEVDNVRKIEIIDIINECKEVEEMINVARVSGKTNELNKYNFVVWEASVSGRDDKEVDYLINYDYMKNECIKIQTMLKQIVKDMENKKIGKHEHMYKVLIELFNSKERCNEYIDLLNYLESRWIKITFGKCEVVRKNHYNISLYILSNLYSLLWSLNPATDIVKK
jgi:hypothetical protein